MKKVTALFICIAFCLALPGVALAFEKAKTKLTSVKQKGSQVIFTLSSSKKFIVGGNDYILFVGNKHFEENKNMSVKGKGVMTFYMTEQDFSGLREGDEMYLTYGHMSNDEKHEGEYLGTLAQQDNKRVWPLGKFSNKLLTK